MLGGPLQTLAEAFLPRAPVFSLVLLGKTGETIGERYWAIENQFSKWRLLMAYRTPGGTRRDEAPFR